MLKEQSEFGLASQYARAIRNGLGDYKGFWCDTHCHSRLSGKFRKALQRGPGVKGKRTLCGQGLKELELFAFDKQKICGRYFNSVPRLEWDKQEGLIRFSFSDKLRGPADKLIVVVVFLSNAVYDKGYVLLKPCWQGRSFFKEMDEFGDGEKKVLKVGEVVPEGVFSVVVLGLKWRERSIGWVLGGIARDRVAR